MINIIIEQIICMSYFLKETLVVAQCSYIPISINIFGYLVV